jgi:hypothetical protein
MMASHLTSNICVPNELIQINFNKVIKNVQFVVSYVTHDVTSPEVMGRFKKLLNSMCTWTSKKPGGIRSESNVGKQKPKGLIYSGRGPIFPNPMLICF